MESRGGAWSRCPVAVIRRLVSRIMSRETSLGCTSIQAALQARDPESARPTVSKYMVRRRVPITGWKTFLAHTTPHIAPSFVRRAAHGFSSLWLVTHPPCSDATWFGSRHRQADGRLIAPRSPRFSLVSGAPVLIRDRACFGWLGGTRRLASHGHPGTTTRPGSPLHNGT